MSRPSIVIAACIAGLERGMARAEVASAAGISLRTLEGWIAAGEHAPAATETEPAGPSRQLWEAAQRNLAEHLRERRRDAGRQGRSRHRVRPGRATGL